MIVGLAAWFAVAPFAYGAVTVTSPLDYATVETHGLHLKAFEALTQAQRESTTYLGSINTAWRKEAEAAYNENSLPITLSWSGTSGSTTVKVTCNRTGEVVFETTTTSMSVEMQNYEIGRNYTWTISNAAGSATGHFYVGRSAPRIIPLGLCHASAARDCGGWMAESGKVVKQGKVFRSAAFDWVYDDATTLAEFKDYWNNVVGLKTEIDLREEKYWKLFQATYGWTGSTFGPSVRLWCSQTELGSDYKSGSYKSAITDANMRTAMKGALLLFADAANYPVLFHCSQGRDRTGTLAFILNGMLGVSLDDLYLDYDYTDYSKDEYAGPKASNGWITSLCDQLKTSYPDASYPTLQDKCVAYVKKCGLTDANIASIKANLLETAETAGGATPVEEDTFVYTEYYWMRTGVGSAWADDKSYWYKDSSGKAKWSPANCVNNYNAAVYIWSNAAFPNSFPATGEFHIGKLVTHNESTGKCGIGNSPKGYFTNSGHSVTDRALWTHECGVAGAERFRMWLEGSGFGHVDVLANARLNLSAFETQTDNIYLNFPPGNCDGATVCFYDLNGSQTQSSFGWLAGGQAGTTQHLIVSNALLSVTSTSEASGVAGKLALGFVLGDNNTTASAAMMKVTKSLTINSGSTLAVDAGQKAVGTYKLLSAGTLTCDASFCSNASVTGCKSGTTGTVQKSGNQINLIIANAGDDPEPPVVDPTEYGAADTKAATYTWKGGDGPWNFTTNWTPSASATYGIPNHATYATADFPVTLTEATACTAASGVSVKNALFGSPNLTLTIDNATLTVTGKISDGNYGAYNFGNTATGNPKIVFRGANPGIVATMNDWRSNFGCTTAGASGFCTVRFEVPAANWSQAPIRTGANTPEAYVAFWSNVRFEIDATALGVPSADAPLTVPLATGGSGVRFMASNFDETLSRSTVSVAAGAKGTVALNGNTLELTVAADDEPQPEPVVDPTVYGAADTKAVTYTWKGGSGPWNFTTNWTPSASATYGIPNNKTYATADFPATLTEAFVCTVSNNMTVKFALFDAPNMTLALDNASLTCNDRIDTAATWGAYNFGNTATGSPTVEFRGAKAALVTTKQSVRANFGYLGDGDAAGICTVRFVVPATGWEKTAPIRTGKDSKVIFKPNVRIEVDATALGVPNEGVTNRVLLASSTDGMFQNGTTSVTCATGVRGWVAIDGNDLVLSVVAGRAYPPWIGEADETSKAKYDVWAAAFGVSDPSAARNDAYLLNCANTDAAIEEAKAAFKITGITVGPDGKVTVDTSKAGERDFNGKVEINGAKAVDGSYDLPEGSPDARFFKAFLR